MAKQMNMEMDFGVEKRANVIWFRHGLRLHDNPALIEALADKEQGVQILPIFIFDGESAGTNTVGYNRMKFLLDSLWDLHQQFRDINLDAGKLHLFKGSPQDIFRKINQVIRLNKICMELDCEPIWNKRDSQVKNMCNELQIELVEKVSHTLWDPRIVIKTNGGIPPLTYQMFLHTVEVIGLPPRPEDNPDWTDVEFVKFTAEQLIDLDAVFEFPTPEDFGIYPESVSYLKANEWIGGETEALDLLKTRLAVEESAFKKGMYLPNQALPNIHESPKSMSPHLRFGCLSVRRFYWSVHDLFKRVKEQAGRQGFYMAGGAHITGQLIWREYFYTMSVNNPFYDRMEENPICLNIPWAKYSHDDFNMWQSGKTGFPFVDAAMKQLLSEGWIHHCLRNTVATFLTRGGLWQNWEFGVRHFLKYLLDADWSVCAGNWMWVSSSAFESLLDSSLVTCPVALARRLDPEGIYIKKYLPELKNVPKQYIHEPWKMPTQLQEQIGCVVGIHYPERMIDFEVASKRNMLAMKKLRDSLTNKCNDPPPHCRPSDESEVRQFFWLSN